MAHARRSRRGKQPRSPLSGTDRRSLSTTSLYFGTRSTVATDNDVPITITNTGNAISPLGPSPAAVSTRHVHGGCGLHECRRHTGVVVHDQRDVQLDNGGRHKDRHRSASPATPRSEHCRPVHGNCRGQLGTDGYSRGVEHNPAERRAVDSNTRNGRRCGRNTRNGQLPVAADRYVGGGGGFANIAGATSATFPPRSRPTRSGPAGGRVVHRRPWHSRRRSTEQRALWCSTCSSARRLTTRGPGTPATTSPTEPAATTRCRQQAGNDLFDLQRKCRRLRRNQRQWRGRPDLGNSRQHGHRVAVHCWDRDNHLRWLRQRVDFRFCCAKHAELLSGDAGRHRVHRRRSRR